MDLNPHSQLRRDPCVTPPVSQDVAKGCLARSAPSRIWELQVALQGTCSVEGGGAETRQRRHPEQ